MNFLEMLIRVEMIFYVCQVKFVGCILFDKNYIVILNCLYFIILLCVCESEVKVLVDGIFKMNKEYFLMVFLVCKIVNVYKDDGCKVDNCEDCRFKFRRWVVDVEIIR